MTEEKTPIEKVVMDLVNAVKQISEDLERFKEFQVNNNRDIIDIKKRLKKLDRRGVVNED